MRRYCMFFVLFSLLFAIPTYAADKVRIAIIDLQAKQVSKVIASGISDMIRSDMVDTGLFLVVERNQMNEIIKEQGLQMTGCTDNACAVQVGKLLSANKMLVGEITRMGKAILITVRIVDVEKGVAEYSSKEKARSEDELDKAASRLSTKLVGRITGMRKSELLAGLEEKTMGGYYMRSAVPGWGQFYAGQRTKGWLYMGGFILTAALSIYTVQDYAAKKSDYDDLPAGRPQSEYDSAYDDAKQAGNIAGITVGLFLAVYIANWVDVLFFTKPSFAQETATVPDLNRGKYSFNVYSLRTSSVLKENRHYMSFGMRF